MAGVEKMKSFKTVPSLATFPNFISIKKPVYKPFAGEGTFVEKEVGEF